MVIGISKFPDGLKKLVRDEVERQKVIAPWFKPRIQANVALFLAAKSLKGHRFWHRILRNDFAPYYGVRVVNVKMKNDGGKSGKVNRENDL